MASLQTNLAPASSESPAVGLLDQDIPPAKGIRHGILNKIRPFLSPEIAVLAVLAMVLSHGMGASELHFYGDETRHAMNGVFVRDFLHDLPLSHPVQYTYEYYAKYPAIALPHWPPLFAIVEGLFFSVLGISAWVSHFTVFCFALAGIYFWFRIAEMEGPRSRALLAAWIFPLLPLVLRYEGVTMLEIPQVALCLGTIFYWRRWLSASRSRDLWTMATFAAAALLTSQASIFLVPFLFLHLVMERRFDLLRRWEPWIAVGIGAAVVMPWYFFSFHTLAFSYQRQFAHGTHRAFSLRPWLFYILTLPQQLGVVMLCLSVIGLVWAAWKSLSRYRFFFLWVLSALLVFTLIREREPRHIIIWIPPLVYFGLLGLEALFPWRRLKLFAATGLAVYVLFGALTFGHPRLNGMEQVTQFVLSQPDSDLVYYQGYLNGDFIFLVRKADPQKRRMIAREKQIVVTNFIYRQERVLQTEAQVLDFFKTWGIHYAIIENRKLGPEFEIVRTALNSGQFQLLRTFPISTNEPFFSDTQISVYRYLGDTQRTAGPVDIPMLTIRHDLHADLSRLVGQPWPK